MTEAEWNRAIKRMHKYGSARLNDNCTIYKWEARYGYEVSVRQADGNTLVAGWPLDRIKEIFVDGLLLKGRRMRKEG